MMMKKPPTVLHLTDLHFGAKYKYDQNVIIDALKKDLRKNTQGAFAPNFLCFSGDLTFSGTAESFSSALEILLEIADAASIPESNIIIAPGNHDANTMCVSQQARYLETLRRDVKSSESGNALYEDPRATQYLASVFQDFNEFASLLEGTETFSNWPYTSTSNFEGISFISVNTSLLSGTGLPGLQDEHSLIFPEAAMIASLSKVPDGNSIVLLAHHPFSWLAEKNAQRITSLTQNKIDLLLYGHVHTAKPHKRTMSMGTLVSNQGGALYQGRDEQAWAGFATILGSPSKDSWFVKTKRWYEDRREFDDAVELGPRGEFCTEKLFWDAYLPTLDLPGLEAWRAEVLVPHVRENCCDTVVGKSIDEVFVAPEFAFERPSAKDSVIAFGTRFETIQFSELVTGEKSYLISAKPEMGKSSTLNQLALEIANQRIVDTSWKLPIRIDFGTIGTNPASIMRSIKRSIPQLPHRFEINQLLNAGKVVLLVDDLDFRDEGRRRTLFEFVSSHSKCRFVFTTSSLILESAGVQPEISEAHNFTTVVMRPMKASGLASLIDKSRPHSGLSNDALRERLIKESELLNVPLTAVTSTFLIQILANDPDGKPMNQAALIERYLDLLLEKYASPELDLGTFNFRNKLDLLSALAAYMVEQSTHHLAENTTISFISDYLMTFGLEYSSSGIFEHLVSSKVLKRRDGTVSFRLRMFFEYFVAYRMQTEASFREYVFDEARYVTFPSEIALYCALNLKDDEPLLRIHQRYKTLFEKVWGGRPDEERGGKAIDKFVLPPPEASADDLEEFSLATRTNEEIEQNRVDSLDDLELPDDQSQDVHRLVPEDDASAWMAHLILLSGMLKHLELVENNTKKLILEDLIDGWLHFLHYSLGVVTRLVKSKRLTLNGVTYKSSYPDDMTEGEIARLLFTAMPTAAARMASRTLGTEKLAGQLREGIGLAGQPASKSLLKFSILVDLLTNEVRKSGPIVLEEVAKSDFLARAFALKLREIAVRFRLPHNLLDEVRSLTAEVATKALPGSQRQKSAQKSKIIESMKRERVLLSYRNKDEV